MNLFIHLVEKGNGSVWFATTPFKVNCERTLRRTTRFFIYKHHAYKYHQAEIPLKSFANF